MDWKFEKNMYPILDTRVEIKVDLIVERSLYGFNHRETKNR